MKKMSLLFAMLLVLVSSIIFCACKDGYKKLEIQCSVTEIALTLDEVKNNQLNNSNKTESGEKDLSYIDVEFKLAGIKKCGDVSITSSPTGHIQTGYVTEGNKCLVRIQALQPTSEGASVIFTHLGSGKSLSIPLKIGFELEKVESAGKDFVIESPKFEDDIKTTQIEIPTKQLLNCEPLNYTNNIVWKTVSAPDGIKVQSYNIKNEKKDAFVPNGVDEINGTSEAVKSVIEITDGYNTTGSLTISPVSVLDGQAVWYKDVKINVLIMDLLHAEDIKITSETHGNEKGILEDLVLINNPDDSIDKNRPIALEGYNTFSTANIELKLEEKTEISTEDVNGNGILDDGEDLNGNGELDEGSEEISLKSIVEVNPVLQNLYTIEIYSDIDALLLENVNFATIRAIATTTCVGEGDITVRFVPKACVGDVETFTIKIPCRVGERATSFKATNNGMRIALDKVDDYTFESLTPLNDSNSLGQIFKFEMLGTNTLEALNGYKITINPNLLNISDIDYNNLTEKPDNWEEKWKIYYLDNKGTRLTDEICPEFESGKYYSAISKNILSTAGTEISLDEILANKYEYQISLLKDGRQIKFYYDGTNFVSEPLKDSNTIYIKWIKQDGGRDLGSVDFGISISNYYTDEYKIKDNGFNSTCLTYNLEFNRQRTVESIKYTPIKVTTTPNLTFTPAPDSSDDWQFYFEPTMFEDITTYYGFKVEEVLGLNGTQLTEAELNNINLAFNLKNINIGFAIYSNSMNFTPDETLDKGKFVFNFNSDDLTQNIIILGKYNDLDGDNDGVIDYGDYKITISQINKEISTTKLSLYKQLDDSDLDVTVPTADFEGERLQYQYVNTSTKPEDWGIGYWQYEGGEYRQVEEGEEWSSHKMYYKKTLLFLNVDGEKTSLDIDNSYILATKKQYLVDVKIKNENFTNVISQTAEAQVFATYVDGTEGSLPNSYIAHFIGKNQNGENIINTGSSGSFDTATGLKNLIKVTYIVTANSYDYYKLNTDTTQQTAKKTIYIYVYEPITSASFNQTNLYKYDYNSVVNPSLKNKYSVETLTIALNNHNESIFNYTDIHWAYIGSGISENYEPEYNTRSATFTFTNKSENVVAGRIIATFTQFGVQFPIYCDYRVGQPILSEYVTIDTPINTFENGTGYINLKVGESKEINATAHSYKGDVTFASEGFEYVICSTAGYRIDNVALWDNGKLTALSAGRVKLMIIAKDVITKQLSTVSDFFNITYLINDAYAIIDVIISDGTRENPYLISSATDFKNIQNDYVQDGEIRLINKHYALVSNIDLVGEQISFNNFEGTIVSFQQNNISQNRFSIYGIKLTEDNPNLFTNLNDNDDGYAVLENINFYIDFDYIATKNDTTVYLGLIGTNTALIKNIRVVVNGTINVNAVNNTYTIGAMTALNGINGQIEITNKELVGVEGRILVKNALNSTVVLGGVIGENQGTIIGAVESKIGSSSGVEYDKVYYDNQGATADIELQVTQVGNLVNSAIGGVIGKNIGKNDNGIWGTMTNVYSTGKILGVNEAGTLTINNVGGLIGKNQNTEAYKIKLGATITTTTRDDLTAINTVTFNTDTYQITDSYSSAYVQGNNNVGGVVGYDDGGSYKKVYYEIYTHQTSIKGNNNVGGLIGNANNSNLYYCYANSFAWAYNNNTSIYEIVGNTNVGGLIGLAYSQNASLQSETVTDAKMNIVSSLASVSIKGAKDVSGLVGRMNNFGAIYTAYFYGVIKNPNNIDDFSPIVALYVDNSPRLNIVYNNVYAIVNGVENRELYDGVGFATGDYNNGKPYIEYEGSNLVSVVPTEIQINTAFDNTNNIYYDNDKIYRQDDKYGDYVRIKKNGSEDEYKFEEYNSSTHGKKVSRYTRIAELVDLDENAQSKNDYRNKALVLYYYPFNDMTGEFALEDYYALNTVDMHHIIADEKIIVVPTTLKIFNIRTSDSSIVSVLQGGKLLLNSEGQATITIVSKLNPSVTATFVVYVRTKVLGFDLYSNANIRDEYKISGQQINIVKGSSKIVYADYFTNVTRYNRNYVCEPATNMQLKFSVSANTTFNGDKTIYHYIRLNGTATKTYRPVSESYNEEITYYTEDENGQYVITTPTKEHIDNWDIYNINYYVCEVTEYTIPYGVPITISVIEHADNVTFTITALPQVVVEYEGKIKEVTLSSLFNRSFNVSTKKGASAINIDKNEINIMPTDKASEVNVKISTDIQIEKLYFEILTLGQLEIKNPANDTMLKFAEMLDIYYGNNKLEFNDELLEYLDIILNEKNDGILTSTLDIKDILVANNKQNLTLSVKLNETSYYIDESFSLEIKIYVISTEGKKIYTTLFIDVEPQSINSVVARNYRIKEENSNTMININNAYESEVIRPGSTNIITIDLVPSIAVYDYVEIRDLTIEDTIYFQQVKNNNGKLESIDTMDSWVNNGIRLNKYDYNTSKLYLFARLPKDATANITHTIQIVAFNKDGEEIYTSYLNLTAVMYPTVVMTYTYPNSNKVVADTRNSVKNGVQYGWGTVNLAVGVEAGIEIETYHIDENTLKYDISITQGNVNYTALYQDIIRLEQMYGKYYLYFDTEKLDLWQNLIGKTINVTFTASKSLNGVTEKCEAELKFDIKEMVINGISMTHTTYKNELYGDWGSEFKTEFYFDETDISFYNKGYWNIKYTIENTNTTGMEETSLKTDLDEINRLLREFNDGWGNNKAIYFGNQNLSYSDMLQLTSNRSQNTNGVIIKNENKQFVIKADEPIVEEDIDINDMKLVVRFDVSHEGNYPVLKSTITDETCITEEFGFNVSKKTTPFDKYILIHNQQEFENMLEGKYYQLANSFELTNYTPLNVAIGGLNGDGKTISITDGYQNNSRTKAFNVSQLEQDYTANNMYIGLFGVLSQDTIIQNLKVHYKTVNINLNDSTIIEQQHENAVYFGGIAGQNLGVITNVKVTGSFEFNSKYITQIYLGGITAFNGEVNSDKVATITGSSVKELTISGIATIGGISATNYGKIVNTNFAGKISKPQNTVTAYVAEPKASGFVVNNMTGAYISLSYVECGLEQNSNNIESFGITTGFVLNNSGTINNCYVSQTSLASQKDIGGFAHTNNSSGTINNCYAYATFKQNEFYKEFIDYENNKGTITNCYVVTDSTANIAVKGLTQIKTYEVSKQDKYSGFIFANSNNGIWSISSAGAKLLNAGFNDNQEQYEDICNIYDLETFDGYLDLEGDVIERRTYRLVRDIDFEYYGLEGNPSTSHKTLSANFEGNDMVLSNFNIYKSVAVDSIGLFAKIKKSNNNIYVRNLILKPSSIKASSGVLVGCLAGEIDSAEIYNITIDNNELLILGKNAVGGLAGIVKGAFEVRGINSNVSAFATYVYNIASQYNLYMGKNVTGTDLIDNIEEVSYAGSVAGIVDGYNRSAFSMSIREIDKYFTINHITVEDELVLIGETVGAVFGFVGERTRASNITYNLSENTRYQGVYVSGGLVGENRGIIESSSIDAYIYENGIKTSVNTRQTFNQYARINGAIVGLNIGGLINDCYSNIDVYTTKDFSTAGGIVGRNIEGSVYNCSVAGTLDAYFVGGIAGTDYSYKTVEGIDSGVGSATYLTKQVYKNIKNGVQYTSGCLEIYNENGDYCYQYEKDVLYCNNTLQKTFIDNLINKRSNYYSFNEAYMDGENEPLVETSKVLGVVIGVSSDNYYITNKTIDFSEYKYINSINITFKRSNQSNTYITITLTYPGKADKTDVNTLQNCICKQYSFDAVNAIFVYLISYSNGKYEDWTSTSGYNGDYITITKQ